MGSVTRHAAQSAAREAASAANLLLLFPVCRRCLRISALKGFPCLRASPPSVLANLRQWDWAFHAGGGVVGNRDLRRGEPLGGGAEGLRGD